MLQNTSLPKIKTGYGKIHNLLYLSYIPKIINAAIQIKLFTTLAGQKMNGQALAQKLNTDPKTTKSLCEVLAEIQLLNKTEDNYSNTEISNELLLPESPVNQIMDVNTFSGSSGPFDRLLDVLWGEKIEFNSDMWCSEKSILSMAQGARGGMIQAVTSFITSLPEFSTLSKMCDLAGNTGHYPKELIKHNDKLQAHVYDLPGVIEKVQNLPFDKEKIFFHPFDMKKDTNLGEGYDIFFVSHFLYEYGIDGSLTDFLKRVNRTMVKGGLFVSSHISSDTPERDRLTMKLVELQTNCVGYPTHRLPRKILEQSLTEAGFADFTVELPKTGPAYPTMKLAARKIEEM